MSYGLDRLIRKMSTPATLTETPNRLPGSPEVIAEQIAEVERDIAEWWDAPEIDVLTLGYISIAQGKLHILRLQLAEANRRKQNVPVPFPERRMVDSIVKTTK